MFRCQTCQAVSPAGTKSQKLTVRVRQKEYRGTVEEMPRRRGRGRFPEPRTPRDRGGSGHEIVREITVCENCARKYADSQEALLQAARADASSHHRNDDDDDDEGDS